MGAAMIAGRFLKGAVALFIAGCVWYVIKLLWAIWTMLTEKIGVSPGWLLGVIIVIAIGIYVIGLLIEKAGERI